MDFQTVNAGMIGDRQAIETAFGIKPLIYADYTASGRAYGPIESFIRDRVMPLYANTHSDSSLTGRQTNALRAEARQTIRDALGAGDDHAVIFCGSGATAAIHRLIDILELRHPAAPTTVLIGPYEHHSNELPWRECEVDLEVIPLDKQGALDLGALEQRLSELAGTRRIFASFSAASNVTGLRTDTTRVGELVHRHGGRVFWDYAAAAPYVGIDVADKDAVFISPHKFPGGPGTPGLLVLRRDLYHRKTPTQPGGGTVSFVSPESHTYIEDCERREEAGTPGIIESIRAGLVFKLQQQVGTDRIEAREETLRRRALERWGGAPGIKLLGNPEQPSLSILSFQITDGEQPYHYAFIVALLNDLFGIQARGGCSCAGPYGHHLLNLNHASSVALEREVTRGNSVLRPGWVRMNFNYFFDDECVDYLLSAVEMIADHCHALLPYYQYHAASGSWRFLGEAPALPVSLQDCDLVSGHTPFEDRAPLPLSHYLAEAAATFCRHRAATVEPALDLDKQAEALRWFRLPSEHCTTPRPPNTQKRTQ